jgi:membrane protein DedA with SNARE-associated domain
VTAFLLAISFTTIQRWVTTRGFTGGVIVVFCLLFACGLGLPLPEDIPLIISGAFLCTDLRSTLIVAIAAWCGIIGGDCIIYFMGRRYGIEITKVPLVGKHLTKRRVKHVEELFDQYGVGVVGVGRLFAGIRGAVVFVAGAIRFNFIKFIIVDGLAAIVSGGLFLLLGHWIGEKLNDPAAQKKIREFKEIILFAGGFLACSVIMIYLWRRRNVQKLHDTEQKIAERVMKAEKKVADKVVKVVKKPPQETAPTSPPLITPPPVENLLPPPPPEANSEEPKPPELKPPQEKPPESDAA